MDGFVGMPVCLVLGVGALGMFELLDFRMLGCSVVWMWGVCLLLDVWCVGCLDDWGSWIFGVWDCWMFGFGVVWNFGCCGECLVIGLLVCLMFECSGLGMLGCDECLDVWMFELLNVGLFGCYCWDDWKLLDVWIVGVLELGNLGMFGF